MDSKPRKAKPVELDKIPGYKEAMAAAAIEEASIRDVAFLDEDLEICGIAVKQLTPGHLLIFFNSGSPFFSRDAELEVEHVAQFLWIVSPEFSRDAEKRTAFLDRVAVIDFEAALAGIRNYLDEAFFDAPPNQGVNTAAIASFVASIVDEIASEYSWKLRDILQTPIAALFQLMRRIERRQNHKAAFISKITDKLRKQLLKQYKASLPKEDAKSGGEKK